MDEVSKEDAEEAENDDEAVGSSLERLHYAVYSQGRALGVYKKLCFGESAILRYAVLHVGGIMVNTNNFLQ